MPNHSWATALVAIIGSAVLVAVCWWIVVSDSPLWKRYYPRYGCSLDQRWSIPIALAVDVIYASVGLAKDGNTTFWISMTIVVGLQALLITADLAALRARENREP